ncbi:MAG TPA: TolC family protein [Gemmatimonadaceae bacterium]
MLYKRSLMSAAVALAAAGAAGAQQAPKRITFDDAIGIALQQSLGVRQAQNTVALGETAVRQEQIQRLPDLKLSVNGANNIGRNFSQSDGAIVNQQTQSLSSGLSSTITLFDGGKTTSSIRSAQANASANDADLTRARQTAVFTVASDFVALANQREQLRVQEENLGAQQAQETLIKQLVDAGSRPVADLYQQQAAVAAAKLAVVQAKRAVELANIDLIQALQLEAGGTYDFVTPSPTLTASLPQENLDALLARAIENRSDLDAGQSRVDAADQQVKVAKASRLPSIGLSGSYSTGYSSAADLALGSQLDQRRGGSVGIGVSIPIFDRGSASLAEQRAKLSADNARMELDASKKAIELEVRRAYLDRTSAAEQLASAQAQQASAEMALNMTQQRYRAGAATLVEVTTARAQQVQAASAVIAAQYNLLLQQTIMSYYTGELDPASTRLGA